MRTRLPLLRAATGWRRLKHPPKTAMVAVFHVSRCGSTVLADMLARHSRIAWAGEIFEDVRNTTPGFRATLPWIRALIEYHAFATPKPYFGLETQALQFSPLRVAIGRRAYVDLLEELGFRHFILLRRRNLLRVIVSAMVAGRQGRWHSTSAPSGATRVHVDPAAPWGDWAGSLLNILDAYSGFYDEFGTLVQRFERRLTLVYEDDIEQDPAVGYAKVCRFLGLDLEPSAPRLKRTNPYPLEQIIENLGDVERALRGSPYEWMLTA